MLLICCVDMYFLAHQCALSSLCFVTRLIVAGGGGDSIRGVDNNIEFTIKYRMFDATKLFWNESYFVITIAYWIFGHNNNNKSIEYYKV